MAFRRSGRFFQEGAAFLRFSQTVLVFIEGTISGMRLNDSFVFRFHQI
jgi:hypothetical protein